MKYSNILNTDSYKPSMFLQYPPGTEYVESYIESRGGEYDHTVFHGLQAYVLENLMTPITRDDIEEAAEMFALHGIPFNREGWEYILKTHAGTLPLEIKAVKEGSIVPIKNVLLTVRNTDPKCFWLTTYIETALLRAIWYPTTVATISHSIRKIIYEALVKTGGYEGIDYKLHDFGARGVSSLESAAIGGTAHLVNFKGTDNIVALKYARKYYNIIMAGFSIPAAEHSTITSWGKAHEISAYDNMIKQFAKPGKIVAIVSDSYDLWNAITNLWGAALKDQIIASGATVVIRPDSGNPSKVVLRCAELLDEKFGHTINAEGYKVLNHVRIIQGDGINEDSIKAIIANLIQHKYSIENIAFGMGGALLQHMNRDTQEFAMKASSVTVVNPKTGETEERDVFKQPATDFAKASKRGRLMLYKGGNEYVTGTLADVNRMATVGMSPALEMVYRNGMIWRKQSLDDIRAIANYF